MSHPDETIGTAEIADLAGVTRRYATNALTKREDFPRPVMNLSQRLRKWRRADIEAYLFRDGSGKHQRRAAMSAADSR